MDSNEQGLHSQNTATADILFDKILSPHVLLRDILRDVEGYRSDRHLLLKVTAADAVGYIAVFCGSYITGAHEAHSSKYGISALAKLLAAKRAQITLTRVKEQKAELNQSLGIRVGDLLPFSKEGLGESRWEEVLSGLKPEHDSESEYMPMTERFVGRNAPEDDADQSADFGSAWGGDAPSLSSNLASLAPRLDCVRGPKVEIERLHFEEETVEDVVGTNDAEPVPATNLGVVPPHLVPPAPPPPVPAKDVMPAVPSPPVPAKDVMPAVPSPPLPAKDVMPPIPSPSVPAKDVAASLPSQEAAPSAGNVFARSTNTNLTPVSAQIQWSVEELDKIGANPGPAASEHSSQPSLTRTSSVTAAGAGGVSKDVGHRAASGAATDGTVPGAVKPMSSSAPVSPSNTKSTAAKSDTAPDAEALALEAAKAAETQKLNRGALNVPAVQEVRRVTPLQIAGYAVGSILAMTLGWQTFSIYQGSQYFADAINSLKSGQNDKAIASLNAYLAVQPDARGQCLRATAYARIGNDEHAVADFDAAIKTDPTKVNAYAGRAAIYIKHNMLDQAMEDCERILQLDPRSFDGYKLRALAENKSEKYKEAQNDAQMCLTLGGLDEADRAQALSARAFASYRLKDFESSLADYNEALKESPKSAALYASRAVVYKELKNWKLALADCNKAMELDPSISSLYKLRALCSLAAGEDANALADIDRAISSSPGNVGLYRYRGDLRSRLRDFRGAMDDYEYVLGFFPNDKEVHAKYEAVRLKEQSAKR